MTIHEAQCTAIQQRQQGWLFGGEPEDRSPEEVPQVTPEEVWEAVQPLLERIRRTAFLPKYQDATKDWELWGLLLAKAFRWAGCPIMGAAFVALEDSNFHGEAKVIMDMIKTRTPCSEELA